LVFAAQLNRTLGQCGASRSRPSRTPLHIKDKRNERFDVEVKYPVVCVLSIWSEIVIGTTGLLSFVGDDQVMAP